MCLTIWTNTYLQFGQILFAILDKYYLPYWTNTYLPIAFARQAGKLFSQSQLEQKDKRKLLAVGTLSPVTLQIAIVLKMSNYIPIYIFITFMCTT